MTLTTEQLRARAKFWREKAVEAKWESVSIAQDMLLNADAFDELANNREAQPVAIVESSDYVTAAQIAGDEPRSKAVKELYEGALVIGQHLYTAPPAPAKAVAWEMRYWSDGYNIWGDWERITAEQHAEMSVKYAADNDYEFRVLYHATPAPAVPDMDTIALEAARLVVRDVDRRDDLVGGTCQLQAMIQCHIETACRSAILAQSVSSGYKLPHNVREALTLALQAMEFMGDTLNNIDAVCTEDVEYVTPAFNAVRELLAAVPGVGNG
ncbi:hypothetical protein [Serratia marcescens]|uniref:hypothetical protein n=1 Tax=Serratia marcescens TaxID=615 RepID=UPI0013DC4EFA|nr:hypothetical protein [Serratia marcescens]